MSEERRESGGGVLGVALGLAALVSLLAYLGTSRVHAVDGDELMGEWFELDELPFQLVIADGLRSEGQVAVLLEKPDAPDEAPKSAEEDGQDESEEGADEDFDWLAIPMAAAGADPIEVVVTHYPDARGASEKLEALFGHQGGVQSDERDGSPDLLSFGVKGGRAIMDRGRLPWGEYSVLFVHERELERGGTFRDLIRVNLTLPGRALVVAARWPRGSPASKEKMEQLVAALRPRP